MAETGTLTPNAKRRRRRLRTSDAEVPPAPLVAVIDREGFVRAIFRQPAEAREFLMGGQA